MKTKPGVNLKLSYIFIFLFVFIAVFSGAVEIEAVDYENLTLEESLEIALENNRGLLASGEELRGIETSLDMADSAKYPKISFTASYLRMGGSDGESIEMDDQTPLPGMEEFIEELNQSFEQPDSIFQTELSLQQPLYTFGRISSGIDQVKASYRAAEAGFEGDRQELIHEVITTYNNVLLAEELLELQHDIKEQVEGHLDVVQSNLDAGTITELDKHEAMVSLSEVEQEIVEARSNLTLAKEGFRSLLGLARGTEIGLAGNGEEAFAGLKDEVLAMAEENELIDLEDNPQLEALAYQREASEASLEMAEAERFPTIAMVANYSWEDENFGFEDSSWSIGVNVSFDIFDGGQRKAEIEQAEAELRQMEYNRQEAEDGLYIEANRALNAFYDAISQEELTAQMQEQAERQLRLAELRYSEGVGTSTDVLDARAGYSQARLAGEEARFSRIEALADLYLVLGRADILLEEVK